jgi:hypothetical protein
LHEVIVGDGVTIPEATTLSRAAVVRADRLEVSERARAIAEGRGRQVGENFIVHF